VCWGTSGVGWKSGITQGDPCRDCWGTLVYCDPILNLFVYSLQIHLIYFLWPDHSREEPWMSGQSPCYLSKADYSFEAQQADELSFSTGDVIAMAPAQQQTMRNHGWMLAVKIKDAAGNVTPKPRQVGLVPINHFRTLYSKSRNWQWNQLKLLLFF
jgi:hypothetical protein